MSDSPHKDVVIVGGGISGLAALHFVRTLRPDLGVALYEKEPRVGGTVGTDQIDGYSFDWGPNGFLDREPLTLRLVEELGLKDRMERANEAVQNRFILRKGKLRSVPMSPPKFLKSDIMSLFGKLRVAMEPFGKKAPGDDESIYDFAKRRIGREAADYLVQPMVSGVYGGVAERLSLRSCFPIMREMESEYGSLLKAMIQRAKKAKREGKKAGGPAGPGGWLTSFRGGLYGIVDEMYKQYRDYIVTGSGVQKVSRLNGRFDVEMVDGAIVKAGRVVLAAPAYQTARMVETLSEDLSMALEAIDYAPIAVVCSGYAKEQVGRDVSGFGFLVPQREGRRILGSIWTSSIFAERAPEGKVQFRTMVGGDGDHGVMDLTDGELIDAVANDLGDIMQLKGVPEITKIYRWRRGIPQFKIGHAERIGRIEAALAKIGQIHVTGNAYYGIGLNDCVKQSYKVVNAIPNRR